MWTVNARGLDLTLAAAQVPTGGLNVRSFAGAHCSGVLGNVSQLAPVFPLITNLSPALCAQDWRGWTAP